MEINAASHLNTKEFGTNHAPLLELGMTDGGVRRQESQMGPIINGIIVKENLDVHKYV